MSEDAVRLLATVAWKENRQGGVPGMQSIINVVLNRAAKSGKSIEAIILAPSQFSSMSVKSDPEYGLDPIGCVGPDARSWVEAQELAALARDGWLHDLTGGATLYYNPDGIKSSATYRLPSGVVVKWPSSWRQSNVRYTCTIANHLFFVEL